MVLERCSHSRPGKNRGGRRGGVTQDVLRSDRVISVPFGQNIPRACCLSFPKSLAPAPAAAEAPAFSLPRLPVPQGGAHVPEPVMSAACEPVQNHFEGSGGGVGSGSSGAPRRGRAQRGGDAQGQASDDMDVNSNGSSGNESHGDSHSSSRSSGNGKDSALLETTESNKSSNSQSPSPPSSSIAYSLLSASSEQDNPSTSGCSSEQSARVKTQKELMKALKEMKIRLPSEKRGKGKSGTLATLQYALSCVKQVQASQDYYQQWTIDERQPCNLDMPTCTIEELESITSEYTRKNPDTFSVAISFITGKIAYISDQAAFILRCKKEVFKGAKFAEFLAPQDVSIFYGSTAPYHLPCWSASTSATAMDYTQEKSVFCRISGGHESGRELRYYPFRLTPYLAKVREAGSADGQPCCLLIAERIHSGYEAPRIPPDKRIFTTRHTPSCLFQDVDERAAPLLGYLPQDLVGMPVLFYLHPEDRPLMLAIHKKILQYAGQPFDHSPIRFCARNGEYVTIDTSWSSFVNPWSRKVSFIMGRHKVRTGPLNEDVFTAPKTPQVKPAELDFQGLSEQIHRLLLQPVHSSGSMGLCSMGSNASHEQFLSVASSSDSNGVPNEEAQAARPMTFQEICKDVHMVKNQGQQVFIESRVRPQPAKHPQPALEAPARCSLQPALTQGELDREPGKAAASEESLRKDPSNYSYQQINCLDGIIRYLESCNIPSRVKRKCGSSLYTTSSNSDDDKQKVGEEVACPSKDALEEMLPTPESQPKRDERGTAAAAVVGGPLTPLALPRKAESVASVTSQCSFSSTIVHVGDKKPPESDIAMMEEAAPSATPPAPPPPSMTPDREPQYRRVGLTKEVLSVHTQQEEQAFLTRFKDLSRLHVFDAPPGPSWQEPLPHAGPPAERGHRGPRQGSRAGPGCRGRSRKSKAKRVKQQSKPSDSTSSPAPPASPPQLLCAPGPSSWPPSGTSQASLPAMPYPAVVPTYPIPVFPPRPAVPPAAEPAPSTLPAPQFPTPLVAPMVALVLPNYVFPQMNSPLPPSYFPGGPAFPFAPQPGGAPTPGPEAGAQALSRPSTPRSMSQPERAESPLFESRCSSPLQLNLLQMEEMPKPCDRPEGVAGNPAGPAGATPDWAGVSGGPGLAGELGAQEEPCLAEAHGSSNNDALSSSSDLLDLLLQEDSRSGTGSAASGSLGSGSNGDSTSASGTASSKSSNTSKYFGSIDSSENDVRGKQQRPGAEDSEHLLKYVLQDPVWLLMADTDAAVMMTYQLPARDPEAVLREDREKLKQMQRRQPRFTDEQKKELAEVHSWVQKGALPRAINITACVDCGSNPTSKVSPLYDVEIQDMDLNGMLEPMEEGGGAQLCLAALPPEVAMEEEEAGAEPGEPAAQAQAAAGVAPTAPRP